MIDIFDEAVSEGRRVAYNRRVAGLDDSELTRNTQAVCGDWGGDAAWGERAWITGFAIGWELGWSTAGADSARREARARR